MRFRQPTLLFTLLALALRASAEDPIISPPVVVGPPPAAIAVVKTPADLEKQPLIDAGDGVTIRLGLESQKSPSAGGVLLYCRWDGTGKNAPGWALDSLDDQIVGPVRVHVTPLEPQLKPARDMMKTAEQPPQPAPGTLYLGAVKLPNPGKYSVEVFAHDGTLLARDTVEGTQDMAPEWRPWRLAGVAAGGVLRRNLTGKDDTLDVGIAGLPAIPRPPRVLFPDATAPAKGGDGQRLPAFWPTDPSPDLKLTVDQGIVTLVSQTPLVAQPLDNFLVRWWVNGKPAEFAQQATRQARLIQDAGPSLSQAPITLRWKVQIAPALPTTKPGDKIELQVMYCPAGWEDAPRGDVAKRTLRAMPLADRHFGPGDACLLTNKALWTPEPQPATQPK